MVNRGDVAETAVSFGVIYEWTTAHHGGCCFARPLAIGILRRQVKQRSANRVGDGLCDHCLAAAGGTNQ